MLLYSLLFDTWSFPKENINKMLKPRQLGALFIHKEICYEKIAHRNPLNGDFLWCMKSISQLITYIYTQLFQNHISFAKWAATFSYQVVAPHAIWN